MKRFILLFTLALVLIAQPAIAAITCATAIPTSAKEEYLKGIHDTGDTYKIAFIKTSGSGTYGAATTGYTSTDEVTQGTSTNYTTGGYIIADNGSTKAAPTTGNGTLTGYLTFADLSVSSVTFGDASTCALIYNDTEVGKPVIAVLSFTSVQPTSGTLSVDFPASGYNTSLIRIGN